MHQYGALDDTFYFHFGSNDTAGSGADGATPVFDVRLCGAAADAAPVYSAAAVLLTHANYPPGAHEITIVASAANGFAANNTYAVFCTLLVDSQNPTGFVGSFRLKGVLAALSSTGLDALTTTAPTGVATTFREIVVQVWRELFKKSTYVPGTGLKKTYDDAGTGVLTTQTFTDDGTTQTKGAAS